jgi:hypothetical protein
MILGYPYEPMLHLACFNDWYTKDAALSPNPQIVVYLRAFINHIQLGRFLDAGNMGEIFARLVLTLARDLAAWRLFEIDEDELHASPRESKNCYGMPLGYPPSRSPAAAPSAKRQKLSEEPPLDTYSKFMFRGHAPLLTLELFLEALGLEELESHGPYEMLRYHRVVLLAWARIDHPLTYEDIQYAAERGVGLIGNYGQAGVDLAIPLLAPVDERYVVTGEPVSFILIQVKNWRECSQTRESAALERVDITQEDFYAGEVRPSCYMTMLINVLQGQSPKELRPFVVSSDASVLKIIMRSPFGPLLNNLQEMGCGLDILKSIFSNLPSATRFADTLLHNPVPHNPFLSERQPNNPSYSLLQQYQVDQAHYLLETDFTRPSGEPAWPLD